MALMSENVRKFVIKQQTAALSNRILPTPFRFCTNIEFVVLSPNTKNAYA